MAGRKLFCTRCNHGIVVTREVPATCVKCGSSAWRCATTPSVPWILSQNDRDFLKANRIAVDDEVSRS